MEGRVYVEVFVQTTRHPNETNQVIDASWVESSAVIAFSSHDVYNDRRKQDTTIRMFDLIQSVLPRGFVIARGFGLEFGIIITPEEANKRGYAIFY
jgi:hypothetical protein